MPIRYDGDCAVFEGACTVEEAGDLAAWLIAAAPGRAVDLAGCTAMHTAVLQCLMALAPPVTAGPQDAALARWLAPVIALPAAAAAAAAAVPVKPRRRSRNRKPAKAPVPA